MTSLYKKNNKDILERSLELNLYGDVFLIRRHDSIAITVRMGCPSVPPVFTAVGQIEKKFEKGHSTDEAMIRNCFGWRSFIHPGH